MSRDLVAAVEAERWGVVQELGWGPAITVLKSSWAKRLTTADLSAYAQVLDGRDPKAVADALLAMARSGEHAYRPSPAQVAAKLGVLETPAAPARQIGCDHCEHGWIADDEARTARRCACNPPRGNAGVIRRTEPDGPLRRIRGATA